MKKIIDDKDQKIQKLLPKLKDSFKTGDFIDAFKAAYPEDYEMLEERFIQDERQTRSLDWKKNTIPTPEQYLKKAIKDFAKGHPGTLKSTVTGFKKPGKPAPSKPASKPTKKKASAKAEKSKPASTPEKPKKTSKPAKPKADAAKTKATPAETKGKSKPAATPDKKKTAAKSGASKTAGKSEKAKPASAPAKTKTAKKTESKKPAAKKK